MKRMDSEWYAERKAYDQAWKDLIARCLRNVKREEGDEPERANEEDGECP